MEQVGCDVCIVGGGLVGKALALMLARLSLSVVIVEQKAVREYQDPDKTKALALTYATQQMLEKLAVWQQVVGVASPIEQVHVSEQGKFSRCVLEAGLLDLPALGYLVPEAYLSQALEGCVKSQPLITLLQPAQVSQLDHQNRTIHLSVTEQDYQIGYRLVIAADGAQSSTRQALGVEAETVDHQQSALVVRVNISQSHKQIAYERFTSSGTLALLPIGEQRCALIISGKNSQVEEWRALSEPDFLDHLQEAFGFRLGRFVKLSENVVFPLTSVQAKRQIGEGFLIMGNAAHLIHPVAAQGFNLSMQDLAALEEVLSEALSKQEDLSSLVILQRYWQWRESEQASVVKATNGIVSLFSSELLGVQCARHLGLIGLEYLTPLKRFLTRRAVGFGGRVARLIQQQ